MPRCPVANVSWGKNTSHWSYQWWDTFPLFRISIVSSVFWCIKCIYRLGWLVALQGHPSAGNSIDMEVRGKATCYSFVVVLGNGGVKGMALPYRSLCVCRWRPLMPMSTAHYTPCTQPSDVTTRDDIPRLCSSATHKRLFIFAPKWDQDDTPFPPSYPRLSLVRPAHPVP